MLKAQSHQSSSFRQEMLNAIRQRLQDQGVTLADVISLRKLYFRVSVISTCNLSCLFCHNEGAPTGGRINLDFARKAIEAAREIGFNRVQFTGGEPLLRKDIGDFVGMARSLINDVGVTTNGLLLPERIDSLINNSITRIHISLQTETLIK